MENWEIVEQECVQHLIETYKDSKVVFDHKGGSDSSQSDIKVLKDNKTLFYIEAKSANAQCGQFVVLDKCGKFVYSPGNKIQPASEFSEEFIQIMQKSYAKFKACGKMGTDFPSTCQKLEYDWVKDYYSKKKTAFFIVEKSLGNKSADNFLIFPLSKFQNYFDISATYRIKTSGSNNPNAKDVPEIISTLQNNGINVLNKGFEGKHYYIYANGLKNKQQIHGPNYRWQFNQEGEGKYQVRKLSNTNNANVIFSISLKNGVTQNSDDLETFNSIVK